MTDTRTCPFDGCDWSYEYDPDVYGSRLDADFRSELHYEREHAGRVRIQITLEREQLLGPRDPKDVASAALDNATERFGPAWDVAYARAEVLEETDDHPESEAEL